jgi:hypothetical protein
MTDLHDFEASEEAARAFEGHIGRFVLLWADTERRLFDVLIRYAGVSRKVGRAIFSGTRAKQMVDFLSAINANVGTAEDRVQDLAFISAQLAAINSFRDKIVHHGSYVTRVMPAPDKRLIYNKHRAMRKSAEFEMIVDNQLVKDAISDLFTIGQLLARHEHETFSRLPQSGDASTWRYRSPQPERKPGKSHGAASKQPRQPRPSRKSPRKEP